MVSLQGPEIFSGMSEGRTSNSKDLMMQGRKKQQKHFQQHRCQQKHWQGPTMEMMKYLLINLVKNKSKIYPILVSLVIQSDSYRTIGSPMSLVQ